MHLDLALLLSEAKGKLRFYKSEVLKDVLYYNCGGEARRRVDMIVDPYSGRVRLSERSIFPPVSEQSRHRAG